MNDRTEKLEESLDDVLESVASQLTTRLLSHSYQWDANVEIQRTPEGLHVGEFLFTLSDGFFKGYKTTGNPGVKRVELNGLNWTDEGLSSGLTNSVERVVRLDDREPDSLLSWLIRDPSKELLFREVRSDRVNFGVQLGSIDAPVALVVYEFSLPVHSVDDLELPAPHRPSAVESMVNALEGQIVVLPQSFETT